MNNKICVTSCASVGCTFIEWSLHFLSGQTQYYNVSLDQWIPLSQNPLTNMNAHGHLKNAPSGYDNTQLVVKKFDSLPHDGLYSMYATKLHYWLASEQTKIPIEQFHNMPAFAQVTEFINNDFNKILQACGEQQIKLIYVSQDSRTVLYHQTSRSSAIHLTKPKHVNSKQELDDEFQNVFFKNSLLLWNELNLTDIWDVRERLALDLRPYNAMTDYAFDLNIPHHWVNCINLWTRTEHTIKNIMEYVDLTIVPERWQAWLPICKNWQEKQLSILDFCYNQPHIVKAIVNNWYYKIDLTFQEEVIIQHFLIYQYGLNLKTWQLKKFPSNTQDLYKLLEPNIHMVPKIYQPDKIDQYQ
jgi:hypothetical protein